MWPAWPGCQRLPCRRILNGNERVDPDLVARVTRVVRKLDYHPNRAAVASGSAQPSLGAGDL